ncbi:mitochondrial ribosomal protein subunit L20-domain-containing protein, partial [Lophiotrema nucula]
KLLHLPEAPSYTPSTPSPTLVFNPPSSAPNIYHTPSKFLPKNDKRTALYKHALSLSTSAALRTKTPLVAKPDTQLTAPSHLPPKPSTALPPPVRAPYEKKYHLTPEEVKEIQRLRQEDPVAWTRVRLAERFGCSQFFVGMVAKNEGAAERVRAEQEKVMRRWGRVRRMAREDRGRRRESWGRD